MINLDRDNPILAKGLEQISEALRNQLNTGLSRASRGSAALSYEEALAILVNVLPDTTDHTHNGTNPNAHLQGNASAAGKGKAGGRGGDQ
jgi:hypothetical protein